MQTYYPPKPLLISIDQPLFSKLEKREDVVAECKYNGTRLILKRFPYYEIDVGKCKYEFWNREGELLKYQPSIELLEQLDMIKWEGDCVLDGELLHFKTKKIKHCVIIFDVYLWDGLPTTGFTFSQRRKLLEDKVGSNTALFSSNWLTLAPQWNGGFKELYSNLIRNEEIEGLVIKSLKAKVFLGRRESPTVAHMWKVRKPGPTYRF